MIKTPVIEDDVDLMDRDDDYASQSPAHARGSALRLCGEPIKQIFMEHKFVRVFGVVSKAALQKFSTFKKYKKNENFVVLFLDYSYFEISINFKFKYLLVKAASNINCYRINAELDLVSQEFDLIYEDGIPLGHKTICRFAIDDNSENIILKEIPAIDRWETPSINFLLSNSEVIDFERYYTT